MQAIGEAEGRSIARSVLPTAAVMLVARGAEQIIVPAPDRNLAELRRLICAYQPAVIDHGDYNADAAGAGTPNALEIMGTDEFRSIVAQHGRIGYLKRPLPALRAVRDAFAELIRRAGVGKAVRISSAAADAAGAGLLVTAADIVQEFADAGGEYTPQFISLGPAELSLYRMTLREAGGSAVPPAGTIMVYKSQFGTSWLSEGEDGKLESEARAGLQPRLDKWHEAQAALRSLGA